MQQRDTARGLVPNGAVDVLPRRSERGAPLAQGSLGGFMGVKDGDPIAIKRWVLVHEGYRFGKV